MESERGQAGIETLLVLPLLLVIVLAGAEAAAWAAASVLAGSAAGAGARALARGEPAAPAALGELPVPLRRLARVSVRDGVVRVVLRVPALVPGTPVPEATETARP